MGTLEERLDHLSDEKRKLFELLKEKREKEAARSDVSAQDAGAPEPFAMLSEEDRKNVGAGIVDAYPMSNTQLGMHFEMERSRLDRRPPLDGLPVGEIGDALQPVYAGYLPEGEEQGLVFEGRTAYHATDYAVVDSLRFRGPFHARHFNEAVQRMVQRRPLLRTAFDLDTFSTPMQLVHENVVMPVPITDLRGLDPEQKTRMLRVFGHRHSWNHFTLSDPPLFRVYVHLLSEDTFNLSFCYLHNVEDGWGIRTIVRELLQDYHSRIDEGHPRDFDPIQASYRTFIAEEQDALDDQGHQAFWDAYLGDADPGRVPRWSAPEYDEGAVVVSHRYRLSPDLVRRVDTLAREFEVAPKTVYLAAHMKVLSLIQERDDPISGVVMHSRPSVKDSERLFGTFLNTLPLRVDVGNDSWRQFVGKVFDAEMKLWKHRKYPIAAVQREWGEGQIAEVKFNYLHFRFLKGTGATLPKLSLAPDPDVIGCLVRDEYTLETTVRRSPGDDSHAIVRIAVHADTFSEEQLAIIGGCYVRVIESMVSDPNASHHVDFANTERPNTGRSDTGRSDGARANGETASTPQAPDAPQALDMMLDGGPDAEETAPGACHAVDSIRAAAARHPDRTAVSGPNGQHLTYGALWARATRLAHRLRERGVGPESRVAVQMRRTPDLVATLLAVWRAGGAYVPINDEYPARRIRYILQDSGAELLLTDAPLGAADSPAIELDDAAIDTWVVPTATPDANASANVSAHASGAHPPLPDVEPDRLAYVIYTSGSTGQPKGVMVPHRNVIALVDAASKRFAFSPSDVWLFFHNYAFDVSVWEMWGALGTGGRLEVVPEADRRNPMALWRRLCEREVTVLSQTPSAFASLTDTARLAVDDAPASAHRPTSLRYVVFAGESLREQHVQSWFDGFGDLPVQLVNMLGTTETTVHSTFAHIGAPGSATSSEARGFAGTRVGDVLPGEGIRVCSPHLRTLPPGTPGELVISGNGLARGYQGKPRETAASFVPDPHPATPGDRVYLTGDRGRYRSTGELDHLGRLDDQIQIRGYRIEPGEIETQLAEIEGVDRAAVVAVTPDAQRNEATYLVAYVVGDADPDAVRQRAAERLWHVMVPAVVERLDAMPLTPNGKIDYDALPDVERSGGEAYVPPQNETEEILARIWGDVLGVDDVSATADFFSLGGHSLAAIQIMNRVRTAFERNVPMNRFFDNRTIRDLADWLDASNVAMATDREDDGAEMESIEI